MGRSRRVRVPVESQGTTLVGDIGKRFSATVEEIPKPAQGRENPARRLLSPGALDRVTLCLEGADDQVAVITLDAGHPAREHVLALDPTAT